MTFRYPRINILNLKEKEKNLAFAEFGLIAKKKDVMTEELDSYIQERDERIIHWEQTNGLTSIAEILQRNQYMESLNLKISKAKIGLDRVEEELQVKQTHFLDKKKDEQMWQHLRDKSYDTYIQKEKKEEQDRLDEMATMRHYQQRYSS